jgi:hypothetical protein
MFGPLVEWLSNGYRRRQETSYFTATLLYEWSMVPWLEAQSILGDHEQETQLMLQICQRIGDAGPGSL